MRCFLAYATSHDFVLFGAAQGNSIEFFLHGIDTVQAGHFEQSEKSFRIEAV